MKNITLSVDDDTYRQARIAAAERGTTLSALVRDYLRTMPRRDGSASGRADALLDALDRVGTYRAATRASRDESHARGRVR